jgi:hypothetical protein
MDGFVVVVAAIVVDGTEGAVGVDETLRAGVGSCVLDPEPEPHPVTTTAHRLPRPPEPQVASTGSAECPVCALDASGRASGGGVREGPIMLRIITRDRTRSALQSGPSRAPDNRVDDGRAFTDGGRVTS